MIHVSKMVRNSSGEKGKCRTGKKGDSETNVTERAGAAECTEVLPM